MPQTDTMALDVELQGRRLPGIIDTGATVSVILPNLSARETSTPRGLFSSELGMVK